MPSTITSLRATLFLAPALVLTACQPAISLLEMVAERNNALTAAGGERERPAPSKPADDTAALDTQEAEAVALSTDKPLEETAPDEPEARVDAGSGVVYAAPLATATAAPPPTSTPDPFQEAGDPVRLEIPAIQVDAFIELVGLTPQDAMDVPKGWMNAGWYHKGFRPGEAGNAVIAGHLDSSTGGPAVFWSLNQLAPGDEVFVTYSSGLRLQFQVEGNQVYDHDAEGPTIDTIFGSSQTADLNLITCKGAWDYGNATYSERLVVFTHLVGEAPVDTVSQ
ncbi:MAG: class F sortase [Ardenticatenia bacterium]|nr:class F sortase [Ardenticatenia bacterium]